MEKWILGIDIGGTRTKVGHVDGEMFVVPESCMFTTVKDNLEKFFQYILAATDRVCQHCGIARNELKGVGVCLTENGKFVEQEAATHLAGHIKVRGKEGKADGMYFFTGYDCAGRRNHKSIWALS